MTTILNTHRSIAPPPTASNGPTTLAFTQHQENPKPKPSTRSQSPIKPLPQLQREQTPPILQLRLHPKSPLPLPDEQTENPHIEQNITIPLCAQILDVRAVRIANSEVRIVIVSHRLQRDSVRYRLVALAIRILRRQADLQHCFGQIGVGDGSRGFFGPEAAAEPDEEDLVAFEGSLADG